MYNPKPARFLSEDPISFAAGDANLYRYVGNNPVNNTDPTGLEVRATYSLSTGVLKVEDLNTGQYELVNAFSGDGRVDGAVNNFRLTHSKDVGPIPLGRYAILELNPKDGFYRLDPIDLIQNNDIDERPAIINGHPYPIPDPKLYRTDYRLHPGSASIGCITIPDPAKEDVFKEYKLPFKFPNLKDNYQRWEKVKTIIKNTKTIEVQDNKSDTGIIGGFRSLGRDISHYYGIYQPRQIRRYGFLEVIE